MKYPIIIILLLALMQVGQAQTPVASYNFFRDTVDVSGTNNLTLKGNPFVQTDYDSCRRYMSFRNTTGYMEKTNPSLDIENTNKFTITFWMRSTDITTDQKLVGQAQLSGGNRGFSIGPELGVIKAELFGSSTVTLKSNMLSADQWHHIGVIFEETSKFEIYVDGVLDTAFQTPADVVWTAPNSTTNPLRIGVAAWNTNVFQYLGDLDDLQIYDRALSASQIADIYNNVGLCPTSGNPIYVDSSATAGANNGLTWTNAYTDLQEAIDLSCNCPDADIWVAKGTYHPTQDNPASTDNTDRDVTFYIDHPVEVYGGFPTGGGALIDRDWNTNTTVLTGAIPMTSDTAYHVMVMDAEAITSSWTLDGFVIQDGRADGAQHFDQHGGGLYVHATHGISRPNVRNCTFDNNSGFWGGGLSFKSMATSNSAATEPMITNCIFSNNIADGSDGQGGGIYAKSMNSTSWLDARTEPQIINSLFYNNVATGTSSAEGGAIYNYAQSLAVASSSPEVRNCTFYNNVTTHVSGTNDKGGALYISTGGGSNVEIVQPNIANSIFWNNTASDGPTIWKSESNTGSNEGKISHSLVTQDSIIGTINFDPSNIEMTEPLFVDAASGDFHLQAASLAINAGDDFNFPFGTTDLDGNPRVFGSAVDMGVYEGDFCLLTTDNIIYVNSDIEDSDNSGLTWDNALDNLQEAIDISKTCAGSQEIWLAKGTYFPNEDSDDDTTFYIDHAVEIYGGFDGTETNRAQRDWHINLTILDGVLDHDNPDTAYHVVTMEAATICPDWVLDGVQITNGRAKATSGFNSSGAGLKLSATTQASPTIRNCTFYNNKSYGNGGAIDAHLSDESTDDVIHMEMTNCVFYNNHAGLNNEGDGGAIYLNTPAGGDNSPVIINTLFYNNTAQGDGGAISAAAFGISGSGHLGLELLNCTVADNQAVGDGGGIHMSADTDAFEIYNSIFWNNTVGNGKQGDDIFTNGTQGSIDSTLISQGNNAISAQNLQVANWITQDPAFVAPGTDYSLMQMSPAINAGKNSLVPSGVDKDIIGGQRILNGQVDIGAYEVVACGMDILYVDIDAPPGGDGLSWASAFDNLQDAIDISAICTGIQSIWMAEGYYYPTKVFDANEDGTLDERERTFYIDHNVKIYGGFEGDETEVTQRNKVDHRTYLDGDHDGAGAVPDQSYHVLFIDSDASGSVIDMTTEIVDLYIIGGVAEGSNINGVGGGAYIRASGTTASPIFDGCLFEYNRSSTNGGAIYNLGRNGGTNATSFVNCSFSSNSAEFTGGAVYNFADGQNTKVASSFVNCVFLSNDAIEGIAIYNHASVGETASTIVNCSFSSHSNNGAVIHNSNSTTTISNSILWNPGNAEIENGSGSSAVVTYSIIEGGLPDQTTGSNNLDTDPLFTSSSDLTLSSTSPAINAGINDSIPASILLDITGLDRINCDTIDMGAHEFQVPLQISCSGSITLDTDLNMCTTASANVNLVSPTANCNITATNDAPASFPVGSTTFKWFVVDTDGRRDTCEQTVTVVDNEKPTITCPGSITVDTDAGSCVATNVSLGNPISSDNCTGETVSNDALSSYPIGETMVKWIITDAAGNKDSCIQIVTVMDNEKPTITCPDDITITRVAGSCGSTIDFGMATATDNCTGMITVVNDAPADFPSGMTTVTWTATDAAMNMQTCTQIVTVNEVTPSCPMLGDSIFVDSAAMGMSTGLTWDDAFVNLQDAIDLACDCAMGDTIPEIHVMEGTYYPCKEFDADESGGADPREATFYVNKNLKIYGGYFNQGSTIRRDWEDHPSILSGDIGVKDDVSDNSYHVMYVDGTTTSGIIDRTMVLDGFHLTKGNADGSYLLALLGGGIINNGMGDASEASPTIQNCIITNNHADNRGGAIDNFVSTGVSSPLITNCVFKNNYSFQGGAIGNSGQEGDASPEILNCKFISNTSYFGGAIYNDGSDGECSPLISNCIFEKNEAGQGGAIFNNGNGRIDLDGTLLSMVTNSTFANNTTSSLNSGAIHTKGIDIGTSDFAHPIINNSIFWNNGAEIYNEEDAVTTITNSLLEDAAEDGAIDPIAGTIFIGSNLDAYPMFQDSMNGNFRLLSGSPAIDAGDSSLVRSVYDISGRNVRILGQVDMGAYEFQSCNKGLRFYLPGTFNNQSRYLGTDQDVEISSSIRSSSDMDFSMRTGMTMLQGFEVEQGSTLQVYLFGCDP